MRLEKLSLVNFRNHVLKTIEFGSSPNSGPTTVIVGANTSGKTNILEAIYLLSTGESFRDGKIETMVNWGAEVSHVGGKIFGVNFDSRNTKQTANNFGLPNSSEQNDETELQVVLTRGEVQGKKVSKRRYLVNGVGRAKRTFSQNLKVVSFRPEDLRIVEGSPARRRKSVDEIIYQVDWKYVSAAATYGRGLVRRNRLLTMIREGKTKRTALAFWDQLLVKHGEYVQQKRREFVDFVNSSKSYGEFGLSLEYDVSVMSEKRLEKYADREVWAGHTLVGPHRDDFRFVSENEETLRQSGSSHRSRSAQGDKVSLNSLETLSRRGRDLAVYGSRGEQRLGVLWLKMMALEFVERKGGERPVLLLDDIFSELDGAHREMVFALFGKQQTVATTADAHYILGIGKQAQVVNLE